MIERPQWNVYEFSNTGALAGYGQTAVEIALDTDAPFRCFGIAIYIFNSGDAPIGAQGNINFTLRYTKADRYYLQRHLVSAQQLNPYDAQAVNGAGGQTAPFYSYFSPVVPNLFFPASGSIMIDFAEPAGITLGAALIVFCGTKLYGDGSIWSPTRNPAKPSRPFIGYSVQFNAANLPIYNQILQILPDADFAWQDGAQTDQPLTGFSPVGVQRNIGIRIKDWTGKYYMNGFIPLDLIFGFNNSQTPGLVYPEIYIPKNQVLLMDLKELP